MQDSITYNVDLVDEETKTATLGYVISVSEKEARKQVAEKYPKLKLLKIVVSDRKKL